MEIMLSNGSEHAHIQKDLRDTKQKNQTKTLLLYNKAFFPAESIFYMRVYMQTLEN